MIDLMPNFTFFYQLGIFLLVLIVFQFLIFRPILRILNRRRELTEGYQSESEVLNRKTEEMVETYTQKMKGARDQGLSLKSELTKEGEGEARALLGQAREDLDQDIEKSRQELIAQSKEAQLALRKYSRDLSQEMAEKLLGRKVSP